MHTRNQEWRDGIANSRRRKIGVYAALVAMVLLVGAAHLSAALVRPKASTGTNAMARLSARLPPAWLDDLEAGLTLATVEYRPVLVFFFLARLPLVPASQIAGSARPGAGRFTG